MEFLVSIGLLFLGTHIFMISAKDSPDASCGRWHEPDGMDTGVRNRSIPQHAQLQQLSTKSCRWPTPCLPATLTVAELLPNKVRRASIQGTRRHMAAATQWCETLD